MSRPVFYVFLSKQRQEERKQPKFPANMLSCKEECLHCKDVKMENSLWNTSPCESIKNSWRHCYWIRSAEKSSLEKELELFFQPFSCQETISYWIKHPHLRPSLRSLTTGCICRQRCTNFTKSPVKFLHSPSHSSDTCLWALQSHPVRTQSTARHGDRPTLTPGCCPSWRQLFDSPLHPISPNSRWFSSLFKYLVLLHTMRPCHSSFLLHLHPVSFFQSQLKHHFRETLSGCTT